MEKQNLAHNACRIDLKVAGDDSKGSGFLYVTAPECTYNYVISAKHIFSEDVYGNPVLADLADLTIQITDGGSLVPIDVYSDKPEENFFFHTERDLAIIRVRKVCLPGAVRVLVKNHSELADDRGMNLHGFPTVSRAMPVNLEMLYQRESHGRIKCCSEIKDISRYHAISGSGVYLRDEPYLVSVISRYPLVDFELNYFELADIDWDEINDLLRTKRWHTLARGGSKRSRIARDNTVIDLRALSVNGVILNLDTALKHLRRDMIDDWFFDPLQYVDMCSRDLCSIFSLTPKLATTIISARWRCFIFRRNRWCSARLWWAISLTGCCIWQ